MNLQLLNTLLSFGGCFWWPSFVAWCYANGITARSSILAVALSILCTKIRVPKALVDAMVHGVRKSFPVEFIAPPQPPGSSPEVILVFPHGFFCTEGSSLASEWIHKHPGKYAIFIDRKLPLISPTSVLAARLAGFYRVDTLRHSNIQRVMPRGTESVVALPGGFVEAVGGTTNTQYIYTATVSYWLRQCKEYGYSLRIFHAYNGSAMIPQSDMLIDARLHIAQRYHIPLVLPTGFKTLDKLVVRSLLYTHQGLPESTGAIIEDLHRALRVDKLSNMFPSPDRQFKFISRL